MESFLLLAAEEDVGKKLLCLWRDQCWWYESTVESNRLFHEIQREWMTESKPCCKLGIHPCKGPRCTWWCSIGVLDLKMDQRTELLRISSELSDLGWISSGNLDSHRGAFKAYISPAHDELEGNFTARADNCSSLALQVPKMTVRCF